MERLRRVTNGTYPLSIPTVDDGGTKLTVALPEVKIYDGAGVQVGNTDTATAAEGSLSYTVPAGVLTQLDAYLIVWSGTVAGAPFEHRQRLELADGFLFEVADLRAFDPAFADTTKYTAAIMRAARTAAEARFERACRQAFVPRGRRTAGLGDGTFRHQTSDNAVRLLIGASIAADGLDPVALGEIVVREWGAFDRPAGKVWPASSLVQLHYEHGLDAPPPEVSQAVMILAREYLVRSSLSSRATVEATDVGFFRLSVAAPDKPTGLPEVDAVIRAVGRHYPRVG